MRVGFVTKRFPNLSETFVLNQVTGLLELGCDVTIFARGPNEADKAHEDVRKYDLLSETYYFGDAEFKNSRSWPIRLAHACRALGLSSHTTRRRISRATFGPPSRTLGRRLLDLNYAEHFLQTNLAEVDVLVCHFGPMGNFAQTLRDIDLFHGKIAVFFHGYDISQYVDKKGRDVYAHLFRYADLLLPISENWRHKLLELGAPREKIVVHKMGIDCDVFNLQERRLIQGEEIRLLSIARLVEKKGIEFGVRAVTEVLRKYPNVRYYIAGDGPLKPVLNELIQELNLQDNVTLLGWQTQDEIAAHLQRSHILLAPSVTSEHGDQEGIPVALMEALAQGIPVISTHHSGIPELVQDGQFGLLTAERNVPELTEAICRMIQRADEWPKMGRLGSSFVRTHHNIATLNRSLADILMRACS